MYPSGNFRKLLLLIIASTFFIACSTIDHTRAKAGERYEEITLHFIDVGDGDSALIKLPGDKNILIDAGSPAAGPGLVEYLKSVGIKRIDHLIFTHPHEDHIGGLFSLVPEFEIKNFYDNGFSNFSVPLYRDYIKSVQQDLSKYNILHAGEELSFGDLKIEVMNPLLPPTGIINEDSIVLRVRFGNIAILLAGDMGKAGERRLLDRGIELKSHILKVGHHGADNASSEEFLSAVKPRAAVISVSAVNEYGRPGEGTLERLENAGIAVYRTDLNGHIVLKTDGRVFSLHTERSLNGDIK